MNLNANRSTASYTPNRPIDYHPPRLSSARNEPYLRPNFDLWRFEARLCLAKNFDGKAVVKVQVRVTASSYFDKHHLVTNIARSSAPRVDRVARRAAARRLVHDNSAHRTCFSCNSLVGFKRLCVYHYLALTSGSARRRFREVAGTHITCIATTGAILIYKLLANLNLKFEPNFNRYKAVTNPLQRHVLLFQRTSSCPSSQNQQIHSRDYPSEL